MFCSKCGAQVPDGSNFCMKCGFNFAAATAAVAQPASQPVPQPAQAPVQGGPAPVIDGRTWIPNSGVVNPYPVPGYNEYNPTFHCRCEYCYYEFDYHTYDLGHRAWYPHGFIYCPRCKKPIRHRLEFEVGYAPSYPQPMAPAPVQAAPVVAAPAAPVAPSAPTPAPAPVAAVPAAPAPAPAPEAPAKAESEDEAAAAIAAATTTIIT